MHLPRFILMFAIALLLCTAEARSAGAVTGPGVGAIAARPGYRKGGFTHTISPSLRLWFRSPAFRRFRGRRIPGGGRAAVALERVGVTIRLARAADLRRLMVLERSSFRLTRLHGKIARLGRIVAAQVDVAGVELLAGEAVVERVELDMISPWDPPLDVTAAEIQADAVWATFDAAGIPLTGQGIIIADIDSGIDLLHPAFFKADGGYYDWIDVDGNGAFDPGVDRVDLNQNGLGDSDETVDFFDGVAYDLGSFNPILGTNDGHFDVGWDHLYVDSNGNGQRDFGPEAGFTEQDATYGEQLLVMDDVNGNGALDLGEKLVALGTSKIIAVYNGGSDYQRGVNLIENVVGNDALHGTGVSGILVGGNRGFNTLVGIAPDAELLMADTHNLSSGSGDMSPLLIWAVQQGADVMLHEYAPWAGYHLDGSSNHEQLMDTAATEHGVAQVNPLGNLGGAMKHFRLDVAGQSSQTLPVVVPPDPQPGTQEYSFMQLSMLWRAVSRNLHFTLTTPNSEVVDLGATGTGNNPVVLVDGTTTIWAWRSDSNRGTAMFEVWVYGQQGSGYVSIDNGTWQLGVSDPETMDASAPDVALSGYVMDDVTSWSVGINFPEHTSEEHLVCFPATADSAIGVAAYTGHAGDPYSTSDEAAGELRRYSGRGLRIDGVPIIDVGAPDNPLTPLNRLDYGAAYEIGLGGFLVFGGTSGAGPHVGGAAALIKQLHPELNGLEVRAAIRDSALVDEWVTGNTTHSVEALWGAGKLRIFQALYGQSPAPNTPPSIHVQPLFATVGEPVTVRPTVSDSEDTTGLQLLWDDNYDGTWDVGPTDAASGREMTFDATGTLVYKVQVLDTGGLTAETLGSINVVTTPTCNGGFCPDGGVSGDGGTGVNPKPSGCGCASGGAPSEGVLGLLFFLLALCWRVRRRGPLGHP